MYKWLASFLLFCASAPAVEKAAYDSAGRIIALISGGEDLDLSSGLAAVLPGGKRVPLQNRRDRSGIRRERNRLAWSGSFQLPDESQGQFQLAADEDGPGVKYSVSVTAEATLELAAIELLLDLPRPLFVDGKLIPQGGAETRLTAQQPSGGVFYRGETAGLRFVDDSGRRVLDLKFARLCPIAVVDRWDARGRSYQVRVGFHSGALERGGTAALTAAMEWSSTPPESAAARLVLDTSKPRFHFDGFGGNYCWSNESPVSTYTLKNLKIAWARTEMKLLAWDKERDDPGPALRADLKRMQQLQQVGARYVISIWWLPERFYTDPYEKPHMAKFRRIAAERWPELLDLVGGYLQYAKKEYGVEPDLFSFNEANLGIYVGFEPEDHAGAIKRFGAHFQKLGLKTKMLLGDATGPRDTHTYVLAAAADAEAMQFVGAVGFHSWGGATPEQYTAWGDVGEWLRLPLLVTELGVDAAAYHSRSWDSYHYGLREARMIQEIIRYARPQGAQFWQFTNDYSLARLKPDGEAEPTSRFWLMKHFTDLTPQKSEVLTTSADQPQILFTAFRRGCEHTLHILNLGPPREVDLEGLPETEWRAIETTESESYRSWETGSSRRGMLHVSAPARSLLTLTAEGCTATARNRSQ